jgi:hypothetical protein
MTDPRLAPLEELGTRLESLLSLLDDPAAGSPAALDAAWSRCLKASAAYRAACVGSGPADEAVRARLAQVLRLNAIAASTSQRMKESVEQELVRAGAARSRLRTLGARPAPRGSCDVQG